MRSGQVALIDALELMDQPLPPHAIESVPSPLPFQRDIGLKQMGFRYAQQQPWIFQGFDLQIAKGSRIGFVGTTGSGKSTLLDIVMGLLTPSEGALVIDGVPINSSNTRAWQAHIAHVPQAIFLADISIAENIAFGVPIEEIDVSRVRMAAERAHIATTIDEWVDGYNTCVGEYGLRLSGGQRQRIAIARALYRNADLIVFDEATSALDSETENKIIYNLFSQKFLNQTVIFITHKNDIPINFNRILRVENLKVNEY
jgi:ATP-binding cassette subfamily B protein